MTLDAPFPYFGGKSKIAHIIWQRFGKIQNYVEPFFGSGAVLLNRPANLAGIKETVNDKDGYVSNFWRAVKANPEETAYHADNPVNENDLHARHAWLLQHKEALVAKLEGDPEYYDAKIAGWWVWGMSCWIGSGFCSGSGPWVVDENRQLAHLSGERGVNRQRVHLSGEKGVNRKRVHLNSMGGGVGVNRPTAEIYNWFNALAERLKDVRVCSGDWSRICGPSPTWQLGMTGVFLDPPYSTSEREIGLYLVDSGTVAAEVREWCLANGDNPLLRIAFCGYEGEHDMHDTWEKYKWNANGGYGGQGEGRGRANRKREVIWFNKACLPKLQSVMNLEGY